MKKKHTLISLILLTIIFISYSFKNRSLTVESATDLVKQTSDHETFKIKKVETITWKAKHNNDPDFVHIGTVEIKSGSVAIENGKIISGEIIIDLTTLQKGNPRLDDHLKNPDFFNVSVFPYSKFIIQEYKNNTLYGALEVLGISHEINFPVAISINEEGVNVKGEFELDLSPFKLANLVKTKKLPEEKRKSAPSSKINIAIDLIAIK